MAPPQKRTKLYAEDAIDRGTGADSITTCVISVFVIPRNAPETTTQRIRAVCDACSTPITIRIATIAASAPAEPTDIAVAAADSWGDQDGEDREHESPGCERVPELVDTQVQRERRVGKQ